MNFNELHPDFKLNNVSYTNETLLEKANTLVNKSNDFEAEIGRFLIQWLSKDFTVNVQTSGSTGEPKQIVLSKQAMRASAMATATYFKLQPKYTALLCLPVSYIAGKMMLVRAMVTGLHIDTVLPKIHLDILNKHYHFVAMIPSQVEKNLKVLNNFSTLIIGGGIVSHHLKDSLQHINPAIFETYGMTETITHIAVKPLNNITHKAYFKTLPDIAISQDDRNCLVINAPKLTSNIIITNDVVNLYSDTEFEWLGRVDHVINSGGLKLFPEKIEAKLEAFIIERFFISSQKNDTFGEVVILIVESNNFKVNETTFKNLNKAEIPKHIYLVPNFVETASGKIQRNKTLDLLF